ncbi:SusC/RagA family TonB-linked outer membrane protein [Sinomicrobium sp. M5D2P17]
MKVKLFWLICCIAIFPAGVYAQETITGKVIDADNQPLPGANILVEGTNRYAVSDFDGNFSVEASPGEVLEVTYIGFQSRQITVGDDDTLTITLQEDTSELDEVVVVGYGTQRKADLTGAITTIESEDIEKTPAANVVQSLQGKVSGVQVVSAGSPGDSPTVRLRGVGSYVEDGGSPLYVVDGMFYDNIDFLNSKDIKSINVLKDASSSAIFGVRAANGVIIIETKSGLPEQKPQFEYDGYTGVQYARNVVKMANTEQFVTMARESGSQPDMDFVQNAINRYGPSSSNPDLPGVDTDWYEEVMRPATIMNHSIGVTGGSETVTYSAGANYFAQEGILDMKNEYERFNIRSKVDIKLSDRVRIGTNMIFSNATKYQPENAAWFKSYFAVPVMPVIDEQNTEAAPVRYSNAQILGYRSTQNPFPDMAYNNDRLKIRKLLANLYFEADLIPEKLTFKTTYNHDFSALDERYVDLPFTLGNNQQRISAITQTQNTYSNQIWDNVLTFKNDFGDHHLTLMGGSSFRDEAFHKLSAKGENIKGVEFEDSWYLDFADEESFRGNVEDNGTRIYGLSFFARASYNFKDKYLLYGTFRAEGSSKYTKKTWGYFPAFGAGWVISKEDFMKDNGVFDFLKLRAGWGRLGNDKVAASAGTNTINVISVPFGNEQTSGVTATSVFSNNEWEFVEEKNVGINIITLNNRLSIDADYYIRDTKNAIMPVMQPIINLEVDRNSGVIRNQGLEVAVNWNHPVSEDFSYSIGTNFSTLKNEAKSLIGPYIDSGSAEFRQRTMVGEPIKAFYGYETTGVYQNDEQIANDPIAVTNNLVPGDLIFKDQNGDGVIDDDDRVVLGSYLPKLMYGGNLGVTYKAWDLSVSVYGQAGSKILNRKRGEVIYTPDTNMDADLAKNRWHGEGTSNTYPSSAGLRKGWNQKLSNFWVEDGDFFRIQNIQLSYTLRGKKLLGKDMPDTRITFTADRPFTFFKYNGFNPEVPDGVDRQTYPIPAVYTVGINVKL